MAICCILWLLGCPLLCLWEDNMNINGGDNNIHSSTPTTTSMYGTPCDEMCGVLSLSVSASMTSHYSKIWGTLTAVWFAVLVIQRTSGGLCCLLKLGLLTRIQRLQERQQRRQQRSKQEHDHEQEYHHHHHLIVHRLWNRFIIIELLGYGCGMCLVGLVALDALEFTTLHNILATLAFAALFLQNRLIGRLEQFHNSHNNSNSHNNNKNDETSAAAAAAATTTTKTVLNGTMFRGWTHRPSNRIFWIAFVLYTLLGLGMLISGTFRNFDNCQFILPIIGTQPDGIQRLVVSSIFWSMEYIFCLLSIGIQLFQHWDDKLWDYVVVMSSTTEVDENNNEGGCGDDINHDGDNDNNNNNMMYAMILTRFSILSTIQTMIQMAWKRHGHGGDNADSNKKQKQL